MLRKYLDFDLLIEPSGEHYRARVLNSPGGQATADFSLPFSDMELENLLLKVEHAIGRRDVRRIDSPQLSQVRTFGGQLFDVVFSGELRATLQSSIDEASRQEAGVRIRLRLSEAPKLVNLPWEYLFNSARNRFIARSVDTPLVRYLDIPGRIAPLAVTSPVNVLVMISSPEDYPPLDTTREWTKLNEALGDLEERGLLTLHRLEEPTLSALQRQLRRGDYQIFHFIGHGGFDEQAQDGVLLLQDQYGRGRPVPGSFLGEILSGARQLRLAILNSCQGARAGRTDPFGGTAQSFVQQGIPAVIAMQFEITDKAASAFSREFYSAIADGYPVDAALAEARMGIFGEGNDLEWATPVLYMRSPDGRIFDMQSRPSSSVGHLARAEEAERLAREEAEQRAREEAERQAGEAAERHAREEAVGQQAREEAEQAQPQAAERLEAERKEAERKAREETELSSEPSPAPGADVEREVRVNPAQATVGTSVIVRDGAGAEFSARIPAGVMDGTRIPFPARGVAGSGEGPSGDLFVRVTITKPIDWFHHKSKVVIAAAVVLLAGATILAIVLANGGGDQTTIDTSSSTSRPTSLNPSTPTSTPPSIDVFPSGDEQALLNHVPSRIASSCARDEDPYGNPIAAVQCSSSSGATFVGYSLFPTVEDMRAEYQEHVGDQPDGSCATDQESESTWAFGNDPPSGRLLCYQSEGESVIFWTYDSLRIMAWAYRNDTDNHALYQFWLDAGPEA
jgi:hypothetical protein